MPYASELVALIDADVRRFDQKAAGVDRTLKRLASSDPEVTVSVDDTRAQADIRGVEAALAGIEDQTVGISADASDARSEVQTVESALAGIEDETVGISADAAQARGEVQGVSAALAAIGDETVAVTANAGQARAEVQTVEAALAGIEDQDVRVTADTRTAAANVQSLEAALAGLEDQTVKVTTETQAAGGAAMGMGGQLKGAAATAGMLRGSLAGIATGAVAMGFWNIASAASDLGESANVVNINFGRAADEMFAFTSDAPRALGMSTRAANEMSAGLAGLLGNMGFAQDETLSWSKDLLTLGADMGSAFNAEPAEAVAAIGSALRGETEPIRRFNVMLSAAKVETEAVTMGLHDGEGALSDYAKAAATLSIIMRDTETVQGDFANTADGMANSTRSLTGEFENFRATLGEDLAPAIAEVQQGLIGLLEQADKNRASFGAWVGGLFNVGEGADRALPPVRDLTAEQYNLAESARTGRDASAGLRDGIEGVGDKAGNTRTKIDDYKSALDRLIGVHLSSEEAHLRWEESMLRVEESLRENGHHLDGNSEKHLKLKGDILNSVQSTLAYASAMEEEQVAQGKVNAFLASARQGLIDKMVAEGMSRQEAERHLFTLGFTKEALDRVAHSTSTAKHRTDEMRGSIETARGAVSMATGVFGGWAFKLGETEVATGRAKGRTDELKGAVDRSGGAASTARDRFGGYKLGIDAVPNDKTTRVHTPGLAEAISGASSFRDLLAGLPRIARIAVKAEYGAPSGDGPGGPTAPRGGKALDRVRGIIGNYPGLRITSTYRTPAQNRAVGGSPTSYHMDRNNPAVDIGGPTWQLDRFNAALGSGWREKLWRAPGHYDHIHVAHTGGIVDRAWGTLPGLRNDERPVIAQVGETILPRDMSFRRVTHQLVDALIGGIGSGPVLANFRALGTEIARSIVTGVRQGVTAQHAVAPRPAPAPPRARHEDEPGWDWRTQGNRMRGIQDRRGFWYHEHADGHIRNTHPRSPGAPLPPRFHTGGIVGADIARSIGLRGDERLITAQVGEGILSRSDMAALASSGGSSAPAVGGAPTFNIVVNIPANAPDAATVSRLAYDAAKAGTAEAFAEERRRNLAMNGRR